MSDPVTPKSTGVVYTCNVCGKLFGFPEAPPYIPAREVCYQCRKKAYGPRCKFKHPKTQQRCGLAAGHVTVNVNHTVLIPTDAPWFWPN